MTMILQLLVAAVTVGLTVAGPPEYKQNVAALKDAEDIMNLNILSMDGNIPLLNDSRRHYAEIVHVIYNYPVQKCGGITPDYFDGYQQYLNFTASDAIENPENVIDEIKHLFVAVDDHTSELKELINDCVQDDDVCNKLIDDTVLQNHDQFGSQPQVLFAAGNVANELKKRNSTFEEVSRNLAAHPYVISTPQDLVDITVALTELFELLHVCIH